MLFLIPLNIAYDIRIVLRAFKETFKGLQRTGWMNIVIIGTMAAILSIFGCMLRTSLAINNFVEQLGSAIEISVYLKTDANPQKVSERIYKLGNIDAISIVTKDKAWQNLKKQMDVPDIKNPLPDTLHVRVKDQNRVENTVNLIKKLDAVDGVQYAQQLARKLQRIGEITNIATFVVIIFLGGLTLFIISNTIHLVIQARRTEIEIMRMMGVGNWYIRAPYLLQGSFYGLCGGLLALLPINILQTYLNKFLNFFQVTAPVMNNNIVVFSVVLMGILVGAGGSILSIRRYLKV